MITLPLQAGITFVPLDDAALRADYLVEYVYGSFRGYRKDRCAIFSNYEAVKSLSDIPWLSAAQLDPVEDYQWTGVIEGGRKTHKRVIVGDYLDWFCWYMRSQRFKAFQVLVLINPISRMIEDEKRGFIDGLLTRLLHRSGVSRVVVLEKEDYRGLVTAWSNGTSPAIIQELIKNFGISEFTQAILSILCGRTLKHNRLIQEMSGTLSYKLTPSPKLFLDKIEYRYMERKRGNFFSLNEEGRVSIESLELVTDLIERMPKPPETLFKIRRKRRHVRSDEQWLEAAIETYLLDTGGFTISGLYKFVDSRMRKITKNTDGAPTFADPDLALDYKLPGKVFLPSESILRRLVRRMVGEGKLKKAIWRREVGRSTVVYYGSEGLPFLLHSRCGQCAFYISFRKQCRLWWLLSKSFGAKHPRWQDSGYYPLSWFELYKMKNAWTISAHSSACRRFVNKKRDYTVKNPPGNCDICSQPLQIIQTNLIVCENCGTRYLRTKEHGVRVLTAYEDKFQSEYLKLAGRKASVDITRLREEQASIGFGSLEQIDFNLHRGKPEDGEPEPITLMLFPGDKMFTKDGKLFLMDRRKVETVPLAGAIIVDHGVKDEQIAELQAAGATIKSVAKSIEAMQHPPIKYELGTLISARAGNTDLARSFAIAMGKSAIHATSHIGPMARLPASVTEPFLNEQSRFLMHLERATPNRYLTYEALIMKQYWACYGMALKVQSQRFGPRKKARFVREPVISPTGRAKGYTAVDSAINYLHQRRLFKIRQINAKLGISTYGEGLLHRKRWNAANLGLVLDLADPVKFADREKLLEAVLNYSVNWRDFHMATDRQGLTFYYPKSEAIATLEKLGDEADSMMISYGGAQLKLSIAYERCISNFASFLTGTSSSFEAFVF